MDDLEYLIVSLAAYTQKRSKKKKRTVVEEIQRKEQKKNGESAAIERQKFLHFLRDCWMAYVHGVSFEDPRSLNGYKGQLENLYTKMLAHFSNEIVRIIFFNRTFLEYEQDNTEDLILVTIPTSAGKCFVVSHIIIYINSFIRN